MTDPALRNIMLGYVYFFAAFGFELIALYGMSGFFSTLPFIAHFLANSPWTYFEFVSFWLWFIILPIEFWYFIIKPLPHRRRPWEH